MKKKDGQEKLKKHFALLKTKIIRSKTKLEDKIGNCRKRAGLGRERKRFLMPISLHLKTHHPHAQPHASATCHPPRTPMRLSMTQIGPLLEIGPHGASSE